VQLDPIKPMLKPPGTKRWKLKYGKLLSKIAFNFNLRRYTEGPSVEIGASVAAGPGSYCSPLQYML
jgi:hypothetical protein